MGELLNLEVVPAQPCDLDFAWYEEIRAGLLRQTVGYADRVLDVGCGRGDILLMLSAQIREGIGVDICQDDLDRAGGERQRRKIANLMFRHADARALPFPDSSFDVVLLLGDVLTYLADSEHEVVVTELKRVLKEGGTAAHESMNWDWEYRWPYPPADIFFKRSGRGDFIMQRIRRNASGLETSRDYEVVPTTPLHQWILEQEWPVSPQGANTWLEVKENAPIPKEWLKFSGVSRTRHYRPRDLERLYKRGGFHHPEPGHGCHGP